VDTDIKDAEGERNEKNEAVGGEMLEGDDGKGERMKDNSPANRAANNT
jgi:hypothetical protein